MMDQRSDLIRDTLATGRRDQFADGFADRAVARWRASRASGGVTVFGVLVDRQFRRLLPAAMAAAAVLAVYNVRHQERAEGQTVVEALLGLRPIPRVTVETFYGLGLNSISE